MTRRLPLFATLLVAGAIATMIALGIWQIGRAQEKVDLIARYEAALTMSAEVPFPQGEDEMERALYRRTHVTCDRVQERGAIAGRSGRGEQGWARTVRCATSRGMVDISLGWSNAPGESDWQGGAVGGVIAPAAAGVRLVAMPAVAGLDDLAAPDPGELPNNHMAYAMQWFFFAATALVIYVLALRRRWRDRQGPPIAK